MNTESKGPWLVTLWGPRNSETWHRQTISEAIHDANTYVAFAIEHDTPLLAAVRSRNGILVHRCYTPDYEPLVQLNEVAS